MMTANHLRRMTKIELVQYGMEGDRQQRRASDELFRREYEKFRAKGLLDSDRDVSRPDADARAETGMPESDIKSLI